MLMTQLNESLKTKYPIDPNRKKWDELDVLKKILFEARKGNDMLAEMVAILKRHDDER